ncbi:MULTISPECIES: PAS domain S-box protein [Paraburkholderia]|uniref:PAS domain S-box protein n=1 Tax=Paraburkholderia ferrariae TaxID=386056 RepID=UPI001FDF09F4|nr:PAS domain S-box protein [Paraburkholderia ferrariae]
MNKLSVKVSAPRIISQGSGFLCITFRPTHPLTCRRRYFRSLLGQNLDLIIPEHLRAAHWRGFEAAMTSGRTRLHGRATLTRAISRTGQKLYVEMTFAMVKNHEGEVLGSVAIARDVTARVEQEKSVARHGGER